jgi:thiosulfate dehydrogenase (quinone) large subunit
MNPVLSPARGLALIRMGIGLYFLAEGTDKLSHGWLNSGQQLQRMLQFAIPRAMPWYSHFLKATVLPHVSLFARLVTLGELAVGTGLVLGLLTPLAAAGAIWLTANYMLQAPVNSLIAGRNRLFILCALVFILSSAGAAWSVDSLLPRLVGLRRRLGSATSTRASPAD